MSRRAISPIGVDLGPRTMSAVQLSIAGGSGRLRVEAAASIERAHSAGPAGALTTEEAARLADVLYRQGFEGRRIVLAVPDHALLTGLLELPPRSSGAPLDQLARMELARIHRRDPESLEVACWDIPSPNRSGEFSHVMAAACDHGEASRLLDPLEESGLRVLALDARAWAMARALPPAPGPAPLEPPISAVLDMDEAGSILAVVRAGVVVYDRLMPDAGLGAARTRLAKELRVEADIASYLLQQGLVSTSPADTGPTNGGAGPLLQEFVQGLVGELRSALDFAVHRYPGSVDRVAIIGPGASLPGVAAALAEGLGLPAAAAAPRDLAECPELLGPIASDPGLTAALGLALWRPSVGRAAA